MKSRTALVDRKTTRSRENRPQLVGSLAAVNAESMGPDCDDQCPYCQGPETD
ncbi:hypothetical protein [Arthrobacter cavernae]|uniref:Uncharacterized protein n=1 Tax=Arthrobacter cavernae TaxID=2817681 RepID=A0A939HL33_9MICC|nr:hypothetical protein [Arthrobacter cavernae]MBO1269288.1 hypothetical protein [Arthrobacter cavernae]